MPNDTIFLAYCTKSGRQVHVVTGGTTVTICFWHTGRPDTVSWPSCSAFSPTLRPKRRSPTCSDQTVLGNGNGPVGRLGCRGASARTAWRAGPFAPRRRDEPRTILPAVRTRARPAGPPRMPAEHARRGPTTAAPAGHAGTMGGTTVATVQQRCGQRYVRALFCAGCLGKDMRGYSHDSGGCGCSSGAHAREATARAHQATVRCRWTV